MYSTEDFLAHHGIKGQKWGVRRFQNEDRTRTPAGLLHESAERNTNKVTSFFKNMDDSKKAKIKKGAKIVAGVLTTAAAGYALYKLGTDPKVMSFINKNLDKPITTLDKKPSQATLDIIEANKKMRLSRAKSNNIFEKARNSRPVQSLARNTQRALAEDQNILRGKAGELNNLTNMFIVSANNMIRSTT